MRVRADDYRPEELVGGIVQGDTKVILSPTQILAASWPGTLSWPRTGDKIVINGRERNIQAAPPKLIDGAVVRIDLQVRG